MDVEKLIKQLQDIKKEHGNIPIYLNNNTTMDINVKYDVDGFGELHFNNLKEGE